MRLLFAACGTPFSPRLACRLRPSRCRTWSTASWRWKRARAATCWPRSFATAKANTARNLPNCKKQGFQRVKVDGEFYDLDEPPTLDKKFRHDIDVVVDRIVIREGLETRLADSFRTALDLADGIAHI